MGDQWRSDGRTLLQHILQLSLRKCQQNLEGVGLGLLENVGEEVGRRV